MLTLKPIKIKLTGKQTQIIANALDNLSEELFSRREEMIIVLSIRNSLEPRINKNKRKATYLLSLMPHEAIVIIKALTPETACGNILQESLARQIITEIQPQLP